MRRELTEELFAFRVLLANAGASRRFEMMDPLMIDKALCFEIWGGKCQEKVVYPSFECQLGHAAAARSRRLALGPMVWIAGPGSAFGGRDFGERCQDAPEDFLWRNHQDGAFEDAFIREVAFLADLALERFGDCLARGVIPRRSLDLTPTEMVELFLVAPAFAWISGFSCNRVPDQLWSSLDIGSQRFVTGPVPDSVHRANLDKLAALEGNPDFHLSILVEMGLRDRANAAIHQPL